MPTQPDISISTSTPYEITASEIVPAGYTYVVCYQCDVKPTGLPVIQISKDSLTIKANPLDCSNSLADKSFPNPAAVTYNSAGYVLTVVPSILDVFI